MLDTVLDSIQQHWVSTVLTERALGEAPGSPRETESRRNLTGGCKRLLGNDPGSKGADCASDGGHFEVQRKGIESVESEMRRRVSLSRRERK